MRFGTGWSSAGVAALLLTAGCKEGKFVGEQPTAAQSAEQAQKQSEKAIGQAKQAQEKATDEQKDAAQAQRDLGDAQKKLTEAEAKARTEAQQAQQAQQQAQQQTQQAQQTTAQSQQSALEAQRMQQAELAQPVEPQAEQAPAPADTSSQQAQQPVAQAPAVTSQAQGEQFIVGQVLTVNDREVLVSDRGEPKLRLQVQPGTQIFVDGRLARATDIEEGSQVRASYHDQGGEATATRIEVTTSVRPATPAAPESGESSPGDQEPSFQPD